MLVEREVEFIDDLVSLWILFQVSKAVHTIVGVTGGDLSELGDVLLTDVALDLVGGIVDVLSKEREYLEGGVFSFPRNWTLLADLALAALLSSLAMDYYFLSLSFS